MSLQATLQRRKLPTPVSVVGPDAEAENGVQGQAPLSQTWGIGQVLGSLPSVHLFLQRGRD